MIYTKTVPKSLQIICLICIFYNRLNKGVKYAWKAAISLLLCILISVELYTFVAENKL